MGWLPTDGAIVLAVGVAVVTNEVSILIYARDNAVQPHAAHTHTHTHTYTHTLTHTHTHTQPHTLTHARSHTRAHA